MAVLLYSFYDSFRLRAPYAAYNDWDGASKVGLNLLDALFPGQVELGEGCDVGGRAISRREMLAPV